MPLHFETFSCGVVFLLLFSVLWMCECFLTFLFVLISCCSYSVVIVRLNNMFFCWLWVEKLIVLSLYMVCVCKRMHGWGRFVKVIRFICCWLLLSLLCLFIQYLLCFFYSFLYYFVRSWFFSLSLYYVISRCWWLL